MTNSKNKNIRVWLTLITARTSPVQSGSTFQNQTRPIKLSERYAGDPLLWHRPSHISVGLVRFCLVQYFEKNRGNHDYVGDLVMKTTAKFQHTFLFFRSDSVTNPKILSIYSCSRRCRRACPCRCPTWLFFSHWKTLILETCSVTTSPISMKTCRKGHLWCENGDAALSSSLFICIQKNSSLTGAEHGYFGSHRGGESSTSAEASPKKRQQVLPTARRRARAIGSEAAASRLLLWKWGGKGYLCTWCARG